MGLDALVYCDCLERGLCTPPPLGVELHQEDDGNIEADQCPPGQERHFATWKSSSMCEHSDGILVHFRLGNAGTIGAAGDFLRQRPDQYPILLEKVLYSGTHCGDQLDLATVAALGSELKLMAEHLNSVRGQDNPIGMIWELHAKLTALRELALRVRRPIVF